jgi:hypothetical protein
MQPIVQIACTSVLRLATFRIEIFVKAARSKALTKNTCAYSSNNLCNEQEPLLTQVKLCFWEDYHLDDSLYFQLQDLSLLLFVDLWGLKLF